MLAMPVGDLAAGSYTVTLNVIGKIDEVTLVDSSGGDYPVTLSPDGKTVTFKLPQNVSAVGLNAVTTENTLTVSYQAKISLAVKIESCFAITVLLVLVFLVM